MKYDSIKQIQENLTAADVNGMSRQELLKVFYKVAPAAQGRVARELGRIENDKTPMSISLGERMKSTGDKPDFSLAPNSNIGRLKKQVMEAVNYLNNKTSTAKGWQQVRESSAEKFNMNQRTFNKLSKEKNFWNTLNKLKEEYPNIDSDTIVKVYGENTQKEAYQKLPENEQFELMRKKLTDIYEESIASDLEDEEYVDRFFE
jgi:hypothetical protein